MKTLLLLALTLLCLTVHSQAQRPWEEMLASVMTADDMEADSWEDTYELLCQLEQEPIDLNTATREDLEQLPFLTALQVEALIEYLYRYAPMKSMNELRMIRELDPTQIALLHHFCTVGDETARNDFPSMGDIMRYGRHELTADARIPFYKRQGDDAGYHGYPYRHTLRYRFNYGDHVRWGLVGAQDAGEPFLAGTNKAGYDFYSYYLQVKHWGRVENAVVGKYKLSVGMGLVLNNSFGLGKLAMLQQLGRSTSTVRPHASRSSSAYYQGGAATVRLAPGWLLTGFLSYRRLDATLNADGTARTLLTDGYHRTDAEIAKKHNTASADAGAHLAFRSGALRAGVTALYTRLSRTLVPDAAPLYRRHYAHGNDFVNISADYGYLHHRFALSGETAVNRQGALATVNSLSLNLTDALSLMLLQRFYSYRYTALYARSMSEGGRVQNESGIYAGLTWRPTAAWHLQAYADYAYFAWARYQASQSSQAYDHLLSVSYSHQPWRFSGRYRLRLRQQDNDEQTALTTKTEHRARLSVTRTFGPVVSTTQADGVSTDGERGYMLSQTVTGGWQRLKVSVRAGYFHTESYAARLYCYEPSPRYAFSFPAYAGRGLRLALMMQTAIGRHLTATAKLGCTRYTDRSTIGSGPQEIGGPKQTDLDLQVVWKF